MSQVSVIIPTYNREKFISRAIQSALDQTYKNIEIIVIDDGSTDHTRYVISGFKEKVKYFYQEHKGISAARNYGILQAQGTYIAFLDSDDEWLPEKLEAQVNILEQNPNIGIVHNKLVILNEKREKIGMKPKRDSGNTLRELLEEGGDLPTSSVITRRECFTKVGVFDESLPTMEDFEMWLRIARYYDIHEIRDKYLGYSHRHEGQITRDKIKVFYGLVHLDKKILSEFLDISTQKVIKRLTKNQYILSRAYYDEGQYRLAFKNLVEVMTRNPWVGASMAEKTDQWYIVLIKLLKTYVYFLISGARSILANEKNSLYRI
jgi:glycosyltransferase involved in cell wall biosynthesis